MDIQRLYIITATECWMMMRRRKKENDKEGKKSILSLDLIILRRSVSLCRDEPSWKMAIYQR